MFILANGRRDIIEVRKLVCGLSWRDRPVTFECYDDEIPNITRVIYAAEHFSPVDTNLRRNWGRSHTAIVECDAEWEALVPILEAAGYAIGVA
jgi:hypothetical protein